MVDFFGQHIRTMKKIILILAAMLTFAACTKEGDVIYQTDPADAPSAKPLVTVIYDPNAVGDGNYNDLLYLETSEPLDGKGSTLCLPYYGAMYEGGAQAQALAPPPPRETLSAEAAAAQPRRNPFCGSIAMEGRQDMIANIR